MTAKSTENKKHAHKNESKTLFAQKDSRRLWRSRRRKSSSVPAVAANFPAAVFLAGKCPNLGRDSISRCRKIAESLSSSVGICRKTFPAGNFGQPQPSRVFRFANSWHGHFGSRSTILFKIITRMKLLLQLFRVLQLQLSGVFRINSHYSFLLFFLSRKAVAGKNSLRHSQEFSTCTVTQRCAPAE